MMRRRQVSSILFLAILILAAAVPAGAASFDGKIDFPTGVTPLGLASGDLNGDGILDLAVANGNADSVSVLLGIGDGRFGTKTDYSMGDQPVAVVVADLDRDGALDVVTANASGNSASVRLGTGDGNLAAKSDFATGNNPSAIAVGDVSGDGRPDLVTANGTPNTTSVLLGVGDGTFGAKIDLATGLFRRLSPWRTSIATEGSTSRPRTTARRPCRSSSEPAPGRSIRGSTIRPERTPPQSRWAISTPTESPMW